MTTRTDSANRTIVFLTAQVFFAFALAVVFLPSAWAGENLSTLRAKAEAGDATAQYELGKRYYRGQGVQIDYAKALYWARLSASQGNSFGENLLGLLYDDGNGVAQNYAKALHWYRLAVRQGNAKAENNLGWLYADGDGVPQNISKAAYWLRLAAKHGYAPAKRNLRLIYFLSGEAPSSALSSSESQSIASQAAKQAVEEANAKTAEEIVGLKREIVRQKAALSPSAPHYSSMVDRPGFQLPKHRNWYAVVVGVEQYPKGIPPAEFSDRDAHAVKSNLIALGYPESHIRMLTNDQATDARIKATLKTGYLEMFPKEVASSSILPDMAGRIRPQRRPISFPLMAILKIWPIPRSLSERSRRKSASFPFPEESLWRIPASRGREGAPSCPKGHDPSPPFSGRPIRTTTRISRSLEPRRETRSRGISRKRATGSSLITFCEDWKDRPNQETP